MNTTTLFDEAGKAYQQTHTAHWDSVAKKRDQWRGLGKWYHRRLIWAINILPSHSRR